MRYAVASLMFFASMSFAAEPFAAPAERLIADLNTAVGHEDWHAAAVLFELVPHAFRGSEPWSELGPARIRINSTRRMSDSEIAIDATILQPGSVKPRDAPVAIIVHRSERGWHISSWGVESLIPPR